MGGTHRVADPVAPAKAAVWVFLSAIVGMVGAVVVLLLFVVGWPIF